MHRLLKQSFMVVVAMSAAAITSSAVAAAATVNVCAPAAPGYASCDAKVVVSGSNHPLLIKPRRATTNVVTPLLAAPSTEAVATPEPAALTPAYLQQAYDLGALSANAGVGDTVAIVDAGDDASAEADLGVYRSMYGESACTTANGCFRKVNQSGGSSYPSVVSGWPLEISLDEDAVSALCPNCHILLVEASSASDNDLATAQAQAYALGADQISDSWGGVSAASPGYVFTYPGVSVVAATGDNGYLGIGQNQYPAALPGVNAAGGTSLTPSSTTRGFSESAWTGAGSGCDLTAAKPSWQAAGGCAGRAYADISADASPQTGLLVYDSGVGGWVQVGGTSLSTPLIASYYALTDAAATSPSWAYTNSSFLNDVSGGSNGTCSLTLLYICNAEGGYSGVSGVGSISGDVTVGAPGIAGPGTSGGYIVNSSTDTLSVGIYPNGLPTSVYVEYGLASTYGQQTSAVGIGSGSVLTAAGITISGLTVGDTYHYRVVAVNSAGTSYGYDFTATATAPSVNTDSVNAVTANGATLNGIVNAAGVSGVSYYFAYGTSSSYSETTAPQPLSGSADTAVSQALTGLAATTTYHYTLVVANGSSHVSYPDQTFTTTSTPLVAPVIPVTPVVAPTPTPVTPVTPVITPTPITTPITTPIVPVSSVELVSAHFSHNKLLVRLRCVSSRPCSLRLQLFASNGRARSRVVSVVITSDHVTSTVLLLTSALKNSLHAHLLVELKTSGKYVAAISRAGVITVKP